VQNALVLITAIGVGGATVIGALIGFMFRNISQKYNNAILGFAAGVMLAAAGNRSYYTLRGDDRTVRNLDDSSGHFFWSDIFKFHGQINPAFAQFVRN